MDGARRSGKQEAAGLRLARLIGAVLLALVLLPIMPAHADAATQGVWERLSGPNAYDTMSAVVQSQGAFADGRGGYVVVATGDGYWDALAASGLAGLLDAPVLITPRDRLADQTRSEIVRLAPEHVVAVGGLAALSDSVLSELGALCPDVTRVSGKTAPQTAVALYENGSDWSSTAIVATCDGYWDALSIAPYAYATGAPVFLTQSSSDYANRKLSSATLSALEQGGFSRVVIVGGAAAVSNEVEGQVRSIGAEPLRLKGQNAIETSAVIATWEITQGMQAEGMAVATGGGYWDALTGAAACGKSNSVLVLSNPLSYAAIDAVLGAHVAEVSRGFVFGGSAAVPSLTYHYLNGVSAGDGTSGKVELPAGGTVVCVGDSITHGEVPYYDDPNPWPYYLGQHLGSSWGVVNLGVSGTTLLDNGRYPYRSTGNLSKVAPNNPAVIFLMLGTNDVAGSTWNTAAYRSQLEALVDELRAGSPQAHLVLMAPPRTFCGINGRWFSIDDSRIRNDVREAMAYVAEKRGTQFIDLYELTQDHAEWFPTSCIPRQEATRPLRTCSIVPCLSDGRAWSSGLLRACPSHGEPHLCTKEERADKTPVGTHPRFLGA